MSSKICIGHGIPSTKQCQILGQLLAGQIAWLILNLKDIFNEVFTCNKYISAFFFPTVMSSCTLKKDYSSSQKHIAIYKFTIKLKMLLLMSSLLRDQDTLVLVLARLCSQATANIYHSRES